MTHKYHPADQKQQAPGGTGKAENDKNKVGNEAPTQKNEGKRTPQSRHDRENHVGGNNQVKTRGGTPQGDDAGARRK
jgi:hypothetical protein